MASVLLSFVEGDKAVATVLAKSLARAKHTVRRAYHKVPASRSREDVDCVIVIWSAAAVASPYVYEDARVALKLRKLVQVSIGRFDPSTLAPVFRAQPLIPIEDGERILRAVLQIPQIPSQGVLASSIPTRMTHEVSGRLFPREAALEKEDGQLVYQVPQKLRRGVAEVVEVRLGRDHQVMTIGFMGTGDVTIEDLPIVETMTVNLYGSPGAFQITPQSRETQLVVGSLIGNTSLDHDRFGRWRWEVAPKKIGTHELTIVVTADLSDSRGVATSEPYPYREFSVTVRVNYASASMRVLKWAATGAVTGLVGAYTHHVWWPKVKVLLSDVGWLS